MKFEEKFWNQRVHNVPDARVVVGDVNETGFDKRRGSLLTEIIKIEIFMEAKVKQITFQSKSTTKKFQVELQRIDPKGNQRREVSS